MDSNIDCVPPCCLQGQFDSEVIKVLQFYKRKKDELAGRLRELQVWL